MYGFIHEISTRSICQLNDTLPTEKQRRRKWGSGCHTAFPRETRHNSEGPKHEDSIVCCVVYQIHLAVAVVSGRYEWRGSRVFVYIIVLSNLIRTLSIIKSNGRNTAKFVYHQRQPKEAQVHASGYDSQRQIVAFTRSSIKSGESLLDAHVIYYKVL